VSPTAPERVEKEEPHMSGSLWYPYAPDQAFGARAAADEQALDLLIADLDRRRLPPPRAGNKPPISGRPRMSAATWVVPAGDPRGEPVTMAQALDAAPYIGRSG
jgi:hypothetical protein